MSDQQVVLLQRLMEATGLSGRRLAFELLGVDERTQRYWLADTREAPTLVLIIAVAIILRPSLADELIQAHEALIKGEVPGLT